MKKKVVGILSLIAVAGGGILWLVCHCNHKFSRPFTNMPWKRKRSYVVCLKCGSEFAFNVDTMEVGERLDHFAVDAVPKHVIS